MALKSLLPGSLTRSRDGARRSSSAARLQGLLKLNLDFTTILLIGGLIQGTLLMLIPRVWMLFPTFIVLFFRSVKTFAVTYKLIPNPQMENAIHSRVTAVIPDADGEFNTEGSSNHEKVAVFLLGLRINHPMGFFAPHMQKLTQLNAKMISTLAAEAPDNGFLGQSSWTAKSAEGSQDLMLLSYWRSNEDVLKFSAGPSHKAIWNWWESVAPEVKHIGISHELFQADKAMYESVYLNFQPTRLGATTFLRKGDETVGGTVPDQWISPLVDASRGKFRTSRGRLGWANEEEREALMEKQGYHY